MTVYHYLDFEPPLADEGWTVAETGDGTAVRGTDGGFPERGVNLYGLRATGGSVGANVAYAYKTALAVTIGANGSIYAGCFFRKDSNPAATTFVMGLDRNGVLNATDDIAQVKLLATGQLAITYYDDAGGATSSGASTIATANDRWYWMVAEVHRATGAATNDGYVKLYVDGIEWVDSGGFDNYDRADELDEIQVGILAVADSGQKIDIDEIKIADAYTEPYTATPADENPSAERTIVIYREASSDSREFADYCVTTLGIPRGMICPLPNATATESLADYATFQTEVETDLQAWLTLNPTAAGKVSCFLIAHGVPGSFTSGGTVHTTENRLMSLGGAFSSGTANALYQTTARLTRAVLTSGEYMAMRVDSDTLQHSKDIIDAGVTVSALQELADTDIIYTDETAYKLTLEFQHLRIQAAAIGTFTNDAFIFGDASTPSWGSAGSRAAFCDDSADSGDTLRAAGNSECAAALITAGYAAALGFSDTAGTYDIETFMEVLRKGYTIAEACRCCVAKTNYHAMTAGSPLTTAAFQTSGYNLYRGNPNIDYDTPVGYFRTAATGSIIVAPDVSTVYNYGLRSVYKGIETPCVECVADFTTDGAGEWVGSKPLPVLNLQVIQDAAGVITIAWYYKTGSTAAADFAIWHGTTPQDGSGAADETVNYTSDALYIKELTLADGYAYYFRVVARTAGAVESTPETTGPLLADATPPSLPTMVNTQTF